MEKLAKSRDIANSKLIILYILVKVCEPIDAARLSEFVSKQRLMSFISFRQYLHELVDEGLVRRVTDRDYEEPDNGASQRDTDYYEASSAGADMLRELRDVLPAPMTRRVDRTAKELRSLVKESRSVSARADMDVNGRNVARLAISDGDRPIMRIEVLTGSREDAKAICRRWETRTEELYEVILGALVGVGDIVMPPNERGN